MDERVDEIFKKSHKVLLTQDDKEFLKKEIERGSVKALKYLAIMHYYGFGVEKNHKKTREYFEKAAKQGDEESIIINMRYKYLEEKQVDYVKLFEYEQRYHKEDRYFERIKKRIDAGMEVIAVESLTALLPKQLNEEYDNNIKLKKTIKSIIEFLNCKNDNAIINVKIDTGIFSFHCSNFYTASDIKKILRAFYGLLKDIDLNQNEEDIFMQIYIKLGMLLHYDNDIFKNHFEEKMSISRNLMTIINKKGVCFGYAIVLKELLKMSGIEATVLKSKRDEENFSHVYNQVKLNGKWYYCDLTNEPIKLGLIRYCLRSREKFSKSFYHQTSNIEQEHETCEDYPNTQLLFVKNYCKLFKKGLRMSLGQTKELNDVKGEGGKTR